MNISVNFCGIEFPNPTVVASGYLGVTGASLANCVKNGAGAVTSKTLFMEERPGHPNPTVLTFQGGLINAVGLCGEGIRNAKHEFEKYKQLAKENPLIGSIGGKNISHAHCFKSIDEVSIVSDIKLWQFQDDVATFHVMNNCIEPATGYFLFDFLKQALPG